MGIFRQRDRQNHSAFSRSAEPEILPPGGDHDVNAFAHQFAGNRLADAQCAAGDNGAPPAKF